MQLGIRQGCGKGKSGYWDTDHTSGRNDGDRLWDRQGRRAIPAAVPIILFAWAATAVTALSVHRAGRYGR